MAVLDKEKAEQINLILIEVLRKTQHLKICTLSDEFCWRNPKLNVYDVVRQPEFIDVLSQTGFNDYDELCAYIVKEFCSTIKECCKLKKKENCNE